MKKCNIIYLTSSQPHASVFEKKIKEMLVALNDSYLTEKYSENQNFQRARAKSSLFSEIHVLDSYVVSRGVELRHFFDTYDKKLSELYVILDYVSFCEVKEQVSRANSAEVCDLIMEYPEVNFAFDEHLVRKYGDGTVSFVDFLITTEEINTEDFAKVVFKNEKEKYITPIKSLIKKELHAFDIDAEDAILRLCYFNDNLFDASNLRFALKAQKYHTLVVDQPNFARPQFYRALYLALVVEEERSQSLFNCYAAYAAGYRALPVTTASGLKWANETCRPNIVLRDYDLQFPDEAGNEEIHLIRGWKKKKDGIHNQWECFLNSDNPYWNKIYYYEDPQNIVLKEPTRVNDASVYYVTKGTTGLQLSISKQSGILPNCNNLKLRLNGIEKPISGIYASLFPMFKVIYNQATYTADNSSGDCINTGRKLGNHGVPLDIYYMVKSMVDRAQKYCYEEKRYIHAAILAQDTIEVLNGFHEALLLQAYKILAISENAIAMNTIGADEDFLKKDSILRIHKIEYEVKRILRRTKGSKQSLHDRRELEYNILNQIFSECRNFCKDHQHFKAEDCFVSAIGHIQEGYSIPRLKEKIKNGLSEFIGKIKK